MTYATRTQTEGLLLAALADAGVAEETTVLLLVAGRPPEGVVEHAYLPPGAWGHLDFRVLRDAGDAVDEFSSLHRIAAYELLDAPESAMAVGFRHEAQHASQFDTHGPALFMLESILRTGMRGAERTNDYPLIPSERDANRSARAYAHDRYAGDIPTLAGDPRYEQFVTDAVGVVDIVGETVAMIWDYVDGDEIDDQDDRRRAFRVVVPELEEQARAWAPIEAQYRPRREAGQPLIVRIGAPI